GHPGALRPLVALLESPSADVRREAQGALAEFPRGELSSDDRTYLQDVLARAHVETNHSTEIPMRVRGGGTGASLLASHPLTTPAGGVPPPPIRREPVAPLGLNFA